MYILIAYVMRKYQRNKRNEIECVMVIYAFPYLEKIINQLGFQKDWSNVEIKKVHK